jgi:hypothetical protein
MNHLEYERPAGAHFDLAYIGSESKKGFKKLALVVRMTFDVYSFRNQKFFLKCGGSRLKMVVGFEPRLGGRR